MRDLSHECQLRWQALGLSQRCEPRGPTACRSDSPVHRLKNGGSQVTNVERFRQIYRWWIYFWANCACWEVNDRLTWLAAGTSYPSNVGVMVLHIVGQLPRVDWVGSLVSVVSADAKPQIQRMQSVIIQAVLRGDANVGLCGSWCWQFDVPRLSDCSVSDVSYSRHQGWLLQSWRGAVKLQTVL